MIKILNTCSQAYNTKLGAPARTDREKHLCRRCPLLGHLYRDQGGRQVFPAYYGDNVNLDVWDTRSYLGKPSRKYSRSSGSSSSSLFDPDDHDIEAYYEDNRDEYDNYEDAYDGFLDVFSAWDEY